MREGLSRALALLACAAQLVACASQRGQVHLADRIEAAVTPHCLAADHPLSHLVDAVGQRVLASSLGGSSDMRFRVLYPGNANAFSLANGAVFVGLPLLFYLNSDDELAMLLGHEIGHVHSRHVVEQQNVAGWVDLLTFFPLLPFNVLTGNAYRQAALDATVLSYSRADEREADDLGAESMRRAGYSLACGVELYRALERVQERALQDSEFRARFRATHPDPGARYQSFAPPAEPPPETERLACGTRLLDRIAGFQLGASPAPIVEADDGSLYLLRDWLQVGLEEHLLQYQRGGFYVDGHRFALERSDPEETVAWAAERAAEPRPGMEALVVDTLPSRERPSVRVAWYAPEPPDGRVEFRHWIEIGDRVYRMSADMTLRRWQRGEPLFRKVADGLRPIDPDALPQGILAREVAIHDVVAGDTIGSLVRHYRELDEQGLALWNGLEPGQPLVPGTRLKVLRRILPTFD